VSVVLKKHGVVKRLQGMVEEAQNVCAACTECVKKLCRVVEAAQNIKKLYGICEEVGRSG